MNLLTVSGLASAGLHLRTVREFKGLTRAEAARRAGVSLSYLQKLETGKAGVPSAEKLQSYCKALGLAVQLNYSIAFTEKEISKMNNRTFLRKAEHFFSIAKEGYTSITFTCGSTTAFALNPEKDLYSQFTEDILPETLEEKLEAVSFDTLPEDEKPSVLEQLNIELATVAEFNRALNSL